MPRKPSLDGKDSSLRIRMSPEQKEKLVFYAERHYQTMSNVIFQALERHRNIEKKIRSLASGNVLTQGFFSPERKGKKNSAVSRKRRKRKFLQVSLLKKCKVGVRRDRTYKLCILSGKLDRLKSHILPSRGMFFL